MKNAQGASSRHQDINPMTPSQAQPFLVTSLSPKRNRLLRRSNPVDDGFLLILLVFFPRRPRPGVIRRSEPVSRAPRDRHAALITAASSTRCRTPPAQRVSARSRAPSSTKVSLKSLYRVFPNRVMEETLGAYLISNRLSYSPPF